MESLVKSDRISPDITCHFSINPYPPSTGTSANSSGVNPATISEVPPGLYEFVIGNNGEVRILCKICQYKSNKKSNFKRHFTNMHFVHDEDNSKTLECCGIRFITKGEKFQHTKSVHKSGYKCTICSKVFDRPALLQRHLAKHTGKKPYKCSLCSYQTPNKANAKRHIEKKHSDVQEGSILFVTDDGEQIQMEVVSKGMQRDVKPASSLSIPTSESVVKSSADSTSFGSFAESTPSSLNVPRSRSASVTSSSLSPPGHLFVGPVTSVFDVTDNKDFGQERKRKITHSIDMIMKQHAESHFGNNNNTTSTMTSHDSASCCTTPQALVYEGNHTSVTSPENLDSVQYPQSHNHPRINEGSYPPFSNWTHSSSHLPLNRECGAQDSAHPLGFLSQSLYGSAASNLRNQGPSSLVFRQCAHGCWHHIDNQITSEFSPPGFDKVAASSSFISTHFFSNQRPDLRSSSSSISQHTENSSITSLKSEDENDSDIIDVVGDDDESCDDSSRKLQLLSSICEGLGSFSTAEIPSPAEGNTGHFDSPPVESAALHRLDSFTRSVYNPDKEDDDNDNDNSTDRYVPKKLRVARAHNK